MNTPSISRREFVWRAAATCVATAATSTLVGADAPSEKRFPIIAFTKPFRTMNPADTAAVVAEVGWDGVELPVRDKDGQILSEQVEDELPKFAEALRQKGREISIVTTDIMAVTPVAEKILRTTSKLGIKRYRLGPFAYAKNKSIPEQLNEIGSRLRDIAALSKELGLQAGFQNHSGADRVGAPIWDIWTMIKDLDPKSIGYCFDIGHATVEGGLSWPTEFRLAESRLSAVFVKDFQWQKTSRGWNAVWCPLGEGMVNKSFFKMVKASKFSGPICQHHEYEVGDARTMIGHFKKDLAVLREWLAA